MEVKKRIENFNEQMSTGIVLQQHKDNSSLKSRTCVQTLDDIL